jgi:transposase-like protein
MTRYSPEFKESVVRRMMPPDREAPRSELASGVGNVPIMRLVEESGVSHVTLAKWRNEARGEGRTAPDSGERTEL